MKRILLSSVFVFFALCMNAGNKPYAYVSGDTLFVGNSFIERVFLLSDKGPETICLKNKKSGNIFETVRLRPDFEAFADARTGSKPEVRINTVPQTYIEEEYLKVELQYSINSLEIKRIYRISENSPAIVCDTYLKGKVAGKGTKNSDNFADMGSIESEEASKASDSKVSSIVDQIHFCGKHWKCKTVEFRDITDWNNNLVQEYPFIPYHKVGFRGNILFAANGYEGIFFLKEAPSSSSQLEYPGHDFTAEYGHFRMAGLGVDLNKLSSENWTKTYSSVLGVYSGAELQALTALRQYQKSVRRHLADRDEMVMMNTWGDRSQDSKVNEEFCLNEIRLAQRLGITHFQIDDGWQSGKSPNSKLAKGSFRNIWDNPDYWTPDKTKYPHGLYPVVEAGKKAGVNICLWFNPSIQNDFADWRKDADALVRLYRQYGIRVFKIDGLSLPSNKAEENLRKLFDTVLQETGDSVVFNLDATAGRRGGYHSFSKYGNIFLENRYTDWGNYFPYMTLRNLWQLSEYVPSERLQIEFLNKWRNKDKYEASDRFAPANYDFEYLFAITLAAQPLAWFEAANLPEEAYDIQPVIEKYKSFMADLHSGNIFPIGNEPDGIAWTGFQSIVSDKEGYFIIYREYSPENRCNVKTYLAPGTKVKLTKLLGKGKDFKTKVSADGSIGFMLDKPNEYTVYHYKSE